MLGRPTEWRSSLRLFILRWRLTAASRVCLHRTQRWPTAGWLRTSHGLLSSTGRTRCGPGPSCRATRRRRRSLLVLTHRPGRRPQAPQESALDQKAHRQAQHARRDCSCLRLSSPTQSAASQPISACKRLSRPHRPAQLMPLALSTPPAATSLAAQRRMPPASASHRCPMRAPWPGLRRTGLRGRLPSA